MVEWDAQRYDDLVASNAYFFDHQPHQFLTMFDAEFVEGITHSAREPGDSVAKPVLLCEHAALFNERSALFVKSVATSVDLLGATPDLADTLAVDKTGDHVRCYITYRARKKAPTANINSEPSVFKRTFSLGEKAGRHQGAHDQFVARTKIPWNRQEDGGKKLPSNSGLARSSGTTAPDYLKSSNGRRT